MNPMKQIGSLSLKKHPVQDHRLQKRVSWIITYACLTLGLCSWLEHHLAFSIFSKRSGEGNDQEEPGDLDCQARSDVNVLGHPE